MPTLLTHSLGVIKTTPAVAVFFLFLFFGSKAHSVATNPYVKHDLPFKRYLTGSQDSSLDNINAVTSIRQDPLGYLWFSGEAGVARFDGVKFEFFKKDSKLEHSLSSSYVWDLVFDKDGVLWLATANGLNKFDENLHGFVHFNRLENGPKVAPGAALQARTLYSLEVGDDNTLYIGASDGLYQFNPQRTEFSKVEELGGHSVRELLFDTRGNLWVGTSDSGLFRFNIDTRKLNNWRADPTDKTTLPDNYIRAIEIDGKGSLWVGTVGGGAARLNPDMKTFQRFAHDPADPKSLNGNSLWDIHRDSKGKLWFATDPDGLALFDPQSETFIQFKNDTSNPNSLSSNKVRSIYDDHMGDLWVGVFPSGINYFNRATARFRNFSAAGDGSGGLSSAIVTRFFEDSEHTLWVGTESGLNRFDPKTGHIEQIHAAPDKPGALQAGAVLAITQDSAGDLWVGTWAGGLHKMDKKTQTFVQYASDQTGEHYIADDYIWSLAFDSNERLWVGTENEGLLMKPKGSAEFLQFQPSSEDPQSLSFRHVWTILEDSKQRLWVGTIDGLNLLNRIENGQARFTHYKHDPTNDNSLSSSRIISLLEDRKGKLWVGTQDNGLNYFDPETEKVVRITTENGLPSNHISSLLEDAQGFIWMSTVNGLAMLNPNTLKVYTLNESNGLVSDHFNRDASFRDELGMLYFGGAKGFSVFDPKEFSEPQAQSKILISDFRIFNKSVYPSSPDSPLTKIIEKTDRITLKNSDSMFAFDFFAVNFRSPLRFQYSYQLEGFDEDWHNVGASHSATYTNLDPGTYLFKVRTENSNGMWNEKGPKIELEILGPWYFSPLAYSLYVLAAALTIVWWTFLYRKNLGYLKQKMIADQLVKVDRLKDTFLANTSHELRTPLNGIIGLTEQLRDGVKGELSDDVKESLNVIASCGRRLSSLIDDILDFAKLSENKILFKTEPVNLYELVNSVFSLLDPLTGNKDLTLVNDVNNDVWVEADEDRLHQIFINLVGNAIKYSDQGQIRVCAQTKFDKVTIGVQDSGPGIVKEDLDKIFTAFIKLEDASTSERGGTGLGLAITKQLIELHGSEIHVDSTPGEGSLFKFTLVRVEPSRVRSLVATRKFNENKVRQTKTTAKTLEERPALKQKSSDQKDNSGDGYLVLVVDDDAVNRMVLTSLLNVQNYRVIEAVSGEEALQIMSRRTDIDLIMLDVMMPKMSGYETCMRIRVTRPVYTLPIIFLTAKNFSDDLVRGFVSGGNDFITKPIVRDELLSRLSTHLSLLEIHRSFTKNKQVGKNLRIVSNEESNILENLVDIVNREMDYQVIVRKILRDLKSLMSADHVTYWQIPSITSNTLEVLAVDEQNFKVVELRNCGAILARLDTYFSLGRKTMLLEDLRHVEFAELKQQFSGIASALLMTLSFESQVFGFLLISSHNQEHIYDEAAIDTMERLRAHITSALVKSRLMKDSGIDAWIKQK